MNSPFGNRRFTNVNATPVAAWPPATALHVHPGIAYSGAANDVESITFPNGLTMSAEGTGNPITIDAQGLHFNRGKYLSYTPATVVSFDGIAVFGRISVAPPTDENGDPVSHIGWLYPITMTGAGEGLLSIFPYTREISSDLGATTLRVKSPHEMSYDTPMVVGMQFDLLDAEYGGRYALWHNGSIAQARTDAETVSPTAWDLGRNFQGTIHEGVIFSRHQGLTDPLFPPGGSSQWAMEQLG